MNRKNLEEAMKGEGYFNLRWLKLNDKEVLCGLQRFAFTYGLVINLEEYGYGYRYCYENVVDVILTINELTEVPNNALDMPGNWIKCKGLYGDLSNPNYNK